MTLPLGFELRSSATRHALKEWAVVVEALRRGRQVFLLRKGGIHEPHGRFRAAHEEFFLVPTQEHQKLEWLAPEAAAEYAEHVAPAVEEGPLALPAFAQLKACWALEEPERALALAGLHVWNEAFVRMRIAYRPAEPLHVLLLRVWELPRPLVTPRRPEYAGCRSWVDLQDELSFEGGRPVLDERTFGAAAAEVRARLGESSVVF
jgi:hypothetical protein